MILADTMAIFFVILGMLFAFNGLWLFSRAVWQDIVSRSVEAHEKSMSKSFFIGLLPTFLVFIAFTATTDKKGGPEGLIGVLILSLFVIFSSIGVSGIATLIGARLSSSELIEPKWKTTARGGAVLSLSYLFPLVGWFVILPVSLVIGCGATIRAIWNRKRNSSVEKRELKPSQVTSLSGHSGDLQRDSIGVSESKVDPAVAES